MIGGLLIAAGAAALASSFAACAPASLPRVAPSDGSAAPSASATPPAAPPPRAVLIPAEHYYDFDSTNRSVASALAVDADAAHAFLGVRVAGVPRAKALGVLTREGAGFSAARFLPLATTDTEPSASVLVTDLRVHGARLYALWNDGNAGWLSTYELDASGAPREASLTMSPLGAFTGGWSGRIAIAGPEGHQVAYVTSGYTSVLGVFALDGRGLPLPPTADAPNPRIVDLEHGALTSVATSRAGDRLLVGAASDTLIDAALHPANHPSPALRGMPREWKARRPRGAAGAPCAGVAAGEALRACQATPYSFVSTGRALFRTGAAVDKLVRTPLDQVRLTPANITPPIDHRAESYALAFDPAARVGAPSGTLWSADTRRVPTTGGGSAVRGAQLTARDPETGAPLASPAIAIDRGRGVSLLAVASRSGTVVAFTETSEEPACHGEVARGYALRFTVTSLENPARAHFPALPTKLQVLDTSANLEGRDGASARATLTAANRPSAWHPLDFALAGKGSTSLRVLTLLLGDEPLDLVKDNAELAPSLERSPSWALRIEVGHREPDGSYKVVRTLDEGPLFGRTTTLFAPGYDASVFDERAFETLTEASRRWRALAAASPARARPRRLGTVCQAMLSHGGKEFVENLAATLGTVGCNSLTTDYTQHLPKRWVWDQFVLAGLDRAGVKYIAGTLDSTKDFLSGPHDDAAWTQREFREDLPGSLFQRQGAPVSAMKTLLLDDEPAWPLGPKGPFIASFPKHPGSRAAFRHWLAANADPRDLGWKSPNEALPASRAGLSPEAKRRFYWTVRYFQSAAASRLLDFKDRIWDGLHASPACSGPGTCDYTVGMNWNNGSNYRASVWAFNTGETEAGAYSWFETMRVQAARPGGALGTSAPRSFTPWVDTKFSDSMAQLTAFRADVIRSAAALPNMLPGATPAPLTRFGTHITVGVGAPMRDGLSYKALASVARGARTLEYWAFGPKWIMPADGWSDYPEGYPEVARANERLGWADTLLAEGERPRGRIAIQAEGPSALWSQDPSAHLLEPAFLHAALTYAGYPVELVDDESIARGVLDKHFDVLFLTQLHTSRRAQDAVARWVEQVGGTLVAAPGAATRSELDDPTVRLDSLLGVSARSDAPMVLPAVIPGTAGYARLGELRAEPGAPTQVPSGVVHHACAKAPCRTGEFTARSAEILARIGPTPAITVQRWPGGGAAYLYAFFPGLQHWLSADARNANALPTGHGRAPREWATMAITRLEPKRPPGAFRPVRTSVPGVEAVSVRSKKGDAIVLFNWTGAPLPGGVVTLTVVDPDGFALALRDDRTPVPMRAFSGGLELTVPLETVEIVRLCRDQRDPECR